MPIHFSPEEMAGRRERAAAAIRDAGLDALLCFKQESMYWLTGYDSFGFSLFQCLIVEADGGVTPAHAAPGSASGAAYLEHRGHPHLEGYRGHEPRPRSAGAA